MDKTEKTIQAFDISAEAFQQKFMNVSSYKPCLEYFLSSISDNSILLDLGCGPGNITKFLSESNNTLRFHGIDLSEEMIKLARMNVPEAFFQVADVRSISFSEGTFDAAVASFCIPFLDDDETCDFINSLSLCIKESGYLYLSTMEGSGHRYEKTSFCKTHDFFFNYYTKEFLEDQFSKNGFKLIKLFQQPYSNDDGSVMNDLIYILQKK